MLPFLQATYRFWGWYFLLIWKPFVRIGNHKEGYWVGKSHSGGVLSVQWDRIDDEKKFGLIFPLEVIYRLINRMFLCWILLYCFKREIPFQNRLHVRNIDLSPSISTWLFRTIGGADCHVYALYRAFCSNYRPEDQDTKFDFVSGMNKIICSMVLQIGYESGQQILCVVQTNAIWRKLVGMGSPTTVDSHLFIVESSPVRFRVDMCWYMFYMINRWTTKTVSSCKSKDPPKKKSEKQCGIEHTATCSSGENTKVHLWSILREGQT